VLFRSGKATLVRAEDQVQVRRRDFSGTLPTQSPPPDVVDRLAGLLAGEELEKALEGLEPEQITGPGGLCRGWPVG
jgi:hypothetical protein